MSRGVLLMASPGSPSADVFRGRAERYVVGGKGGRLGRVAGECTCTCKSREYSIAANARQSIAHHPYLCMAGVSYDYSPSGSSVSPPPEPYLGSTAV